MGFGILRVSGPRRVPSPPARITACTLPPRASIARRGWWDPEGTPAGGWWLCLAGETACPTLRVRRPAAGVDACPTLRVWRPAAGVDACSTLRVWRPAAGVDACPTLRVWRPAAGVDACPT